MTGNVLVGTAGWSYPDWEGIVYPKSSQGRATSLERLASLFDVLEINTTHYQIPSSRQAEKWVSRVADRQGFRFVAKLHKCFTHDRNYTKGDISAFEGFLAPLSSSSRLACVLIQFPWSFRYSKDNLEHMRRLIDVFHHHRPCVEVRHNSWLQGDLPSLLRDWDAGFVNIDQPVLPDNLLPTDHVTGDVAYYRFHGRNSKFWWAESQPYYGARYDYLYTMEELEPWIDTVRRRAQAAQSTIIVTNNHFRGEAVVNALQLASALGVAKGKLPASLANEYEESLTTVPLPVDENEQLQPDLFEGLL